VELNKRCLKTKEAAEYLGCSKSHIEKLVRSGKLYPLLVGKGKWWFDIVDLDKFVEQGKPNAPAATA
jgi:excisionase family DNA binding protein